MRASIRELLLGESGRSRQSIAPTFIALIVYMVYAIVQEIEVLFGFIEKQSSYILSAFYLAAALAFYLTVRTGLSQRFGKDPSLALPQFFIGLLSLSWSYAITNVTRGAILSMLVLILFFSAFLLRPKSAAQTGAGAAVMLICSMALRQWLNPSHHDGKTEVIYLMIALINIGAATVLAVRLAHLRNRLRMQRSDLQSALEKIHILANFDELTGLKNRRKITTLLQEVIENEDKFSFCVGIFDIDHFKRINDTFGHLKGDEVLNAFATYAESSLRATESIGRWGGEEFIVVFKNTTLVNGMSSMERIRKFIESADLVGLGQGTITVSGGLVQHRSGDTMEQTVERADRALYLAKAGGRNRICTEN